MKHFTIEQIATRMSVGYDSARRMVERCRANGLLVVTVDTSQRGRPVLVEADSFERLLRGERAAA